MKTTALPLELLRDGARLWVEGDELRFRAARGVLDPALGEQLSRRKQEIIALRLIGPLDQATLEQSLRDLVRLNETLRTTFASIEGRPVKVIDPVPPRIGRYR